MPFSRAAGTALGIIVFRRVDDVLFRRIILAILLCAGLSLMI
jgi:hypothetical protein